MNVLVLSNACLTSNLEIVFQKFKLEQRLFASIILPDQCMLQRTISALGSEKGFSEKQKEKRPAGDFYKALKAHPSFKEKCLIECRSSMQHSVKFKLINKCKAADKSRKANKNVMVVPTWCRKTDQTLQKEEIRTSIRTSPTEKVSIFSVSTPWNLEESIFVARNN